MPAVINIVGAKGSADGATNLTTAAVTPGGADTAALVFTLGESNSGGGYATNVRLNTSGGAEIDDFTSADVHLGGGGREAFGKVFGEIATPTSSTAFYALWPGAGNGIVAASVFIEDVDQADPFGTEQVSADTALGSGTTTISELFEGGTEGDIVIGCLFIRDFVTGNSTVSVNTGTTLEDSIVNSGPESDWTSLYVVSGEYDADGECLLSADVTKVSVLACARMWGIPVNGASGGGDVTEALTGVATTGSPGTVGVTHAQATTGNATTTGTGALGVTLAKALTGEAATAAVGTVSPAAVIGLTGLGATAAVGTVSQATAIGLSGLDATGAAGTVGATNTLSSTGTAATGSPGTVGPETVIGLTGAAATGAVGTLAASAGGNVTVAITGNAATCAPGTVGPATSTGASGNAATGAAGGVGEAATVPLTGVAATGAVGTVGASATGDLTLDLTGVSAAGQVGSVSPADSGSIAELEEKIDALTLLVTKLAQDVATAKSFYVGGPDHNDYEQRDILRNYAKRIDIEAQNEMLMKTFRAIVTQESAT